MAACPNCGTDLAGEFRFCPFCATLVTTARENDTVDERKVVSVLFCDLVGFTAASDQADPEDVRARLQPYHSKVRQVIERHGGTVEKFVGDAVMAVFGAPLAHEDDPERAVRAALRILESLDELNRINSKLQLKVRIGINTGEAVVALGAHPEWGEAFVAGDVVNTAARVQSAAPVNGVAVSEATHRQTEKVFSYAPLEAVQVKGKAHPLALWRPLEEHSRFGSDVIRTYVTPLVGRELERSLLIAAFELAEQRRTCQLVTLIGEPGVGKTRLCTEVLAQLQQRAQPVRWRRGRSLPYGDGIALWALKEIIKAECGILVSDTPRQASAKVERAVGRDEPDRLWLTQRLAPLVGAAGRERATQEESFTAWRRFVELRAAEGPMVLLFEDLHWADDATLAFVEYLADGSDGVPLLLLCTARPGLEEKQPTWAAGVRDAQRIHLGPLTDADTSTLIGVLLQTTVLPAVTQQALLDRAGGNPLYAEEFVRLLADCELLDGQLDDLALPDSLQSLIAARLDTLSIERKALLQDAAVMGKVFWDGALTVLGDRDHRDVEQALHELARKDFVRPSVTSSMQGEREYGFWHALVRDVCYAQIPRVVRMARHRAAAVWIEAQAGDRVDDLADLLAYHATQALDLARVSGRDGLIPDLEALARRYLAMAGDHALPIDMDSAESNYSRALALAPAGHPERPRLLERWGFAITQQSRPGSLTEARSAFEEALATYRRQDSRVDAARALTTLSSILWRLGDAGREHAVAEALLLLEAEPPGPELVSAYAEVAQRRLLIGDFVKTIAAADQALELASRLGLPVPAMALGLRGDSLACLGEERGLDDIREALALAIEQGRGRDAGGLHNNLAWDAWQYRGPLVAAELAAEGIAFCLQRGLAYVGGGQADTVFAKDRRRCTGPHPPCR